LFFFELTFPHVVPEWSLTRVTVAGQCVYQYSYLFDHCVDPQWSWQWNDTRTITEAELFAFGTWSQLCEIGNPVPYLIGQLNLLDFLFLTCSFSTPLINSTSNCTSNSITAYSTLPGGDVLVNGQFVQAYGTPTYISCSPSGLPPYNCLDEYNLGAKGFAVTYGSGPKPLEVDCANEVLPNTASLLCTDQSTSTN